MKDLKITEKITNGKDNKIQLILLNFYLMKRNKNKDKTWDLSMLKDSMKIKRGYFNKLEDWRKRNKLHI